MEKRSEPRKRMLSGFIVREGILDRLAEMQ
jgi:hypothetical protein